MAHAVAEFHSISNVTAERRTRRVLFISYHFPPVGGAGVQRPAKFVKYLRQFGWEASVLMAANPSVPVFDESLCADLPDDLVVEKARTWEPGYRFKSGLSEKTPAVPAAEASSLAGACRRVARRMLRSAAGVVLQPDAQVLWVPSALQAAKRLLKRLPHDAILATAPPYSNLILGGMLKERSGLPLVLDYRDEWDLSSKYLENHPRDWVSRFVQPRMQRRVLRQADAVVATTQSSARRLQERIGESGGRAEAVCIYNGFDAADFERLHLPRTPVPAARGRFRLVYTGTLWNLTNVEPLVRAVEQLRTDNGDLLGRLELHFVGRKTAEQRQLLDRLADAGCRVAIEDYCDHRRALEIMASADALLLLLSDVEGADRVVPAKLFEYLALRKEIVAIAPHGETYDIVGTYFPASRFVPTDTAGIAGWIRARLLGRRDSADDRVARPDTTHFSREHQAGQLAELLDRLTAGRSPIRGSDNRVRRQAGCVGVTASGGQDCPPHE